jgi:hypothetical protein
MRFVVLEVVAWLSPGLREISRDFRLGNMLC